MAVINNILWDFDGVIINSNEVRDLGFKRVLNDYPKAQVNQLLDYHRNNGGLSRYVKFHYFFEQVRGEALSEEKLNTLCLQFSEIMKSLLTNIELLIPETLNFIKKNHSKYNMHIVSGSDETELCWLCNRLGISHYFKSIYGSPSPKKELVARIVFENNYQAEQCLLIGDSINDYQAANDNSIAFVNYNNKELIGLGTNWEDINFDDL